MDFSIWLPWVAAGITAVIVIYFIFNFFSGKEMESLHMSSRATSQGNPGFGIFAFLFLPVIVFFLCSPNFKFTIEQAEAVKARPHSAAPVTETASGTATETTSVIPLKTRESTTNVQFFAILLFIIVGAAGAKFLSKGLVKATSHGDVLIQNLPEQVSRDELENLFSQSGKVLAVSIQSQSNGQREHRIGIVKMAKSEDAHNAMVMFNGQNLHGNTISVEHTKV